jgi:hypothetical protein
LNKGDSIFTKQRDSEDYIYEPEIKVVRIEDKHLIVGETDLAEPARLNGITTKSE